MGEQALEFPDGLNDEDLKAMNTALSKQRRLSRQKYAERDPYGLPEKVKLIEVLRNLRYEKKSVAFTVKLQPSLAGILKKLGPSWVRRSIVKALEREVER